ncbi:hypothetical protein HNY73_002346 [Argiope bruennichi]|uniref:Uncharacterized protein n=1 Tax=Argiope bruennichi TaxID=94029 RepID=A0A8T0FT76_ARGBR|nr:hypothetical protein HNY73_002346 [Argiope bruennichi]
MTPNGNWTMTEKGTVISTPRFEWLRKNRLFLILFVFAICIFILMAATGICIYFLSSVTEIHFYKIISMSWYLLENFTAEAFAIAKLLNKFTATERLCENVNS